ncbi:MAG: hypothetical protein NTW16_00235 [Bacteroidetes bacterium]|nr:hypothetical protein [Bacteroidota bacterium]
MKNLFLLFGCCILLFGCDKDKSMIKKDLDSRFTKYEIVEIKKDSCNIQTAFETILSFKIRVSETNLKIIDAIDRIRLNMEPQKNFNLIDSIHNEITNSMEKFEKTKYSKPDPCYYVKYLVYKDENKIPKEEYYYIAHQSNSVMHRPIEWNEFMYQEEYDKLIQDAVKYTGEITELSLKYRK